MPLIDLGEDLYPYQQNESSKVGKNSGTLLAKEDMNKNEVCFRKDI